MVSYVASQSLTGRHASAQVGRYEEAVQPGSRSGGAEVAAAGSKRRLDHFLLVQVRVIWALMLRDIRTRFFGHGLGYLIAIAWPLAHMAVLLIVYKVAGRTAPIGDGLMIFFATALVPVLSFQYMTRFIMMAAVQNRPLLSYAPVKVPDLFIARGILEFLASWCGAVIVAATLFVLDVNIVPADPVQALAALLTAHLLGFGFGFINGIIFMVTPGWMLVAVLMSIIFYVTSGLVFMVQALPQQVLYVVSFNPILHVVEWMRMAYFLGYSSVVLDKSYPIAFGICSLGIGLVAERLLRGILVK